MFFKAAASTSSYRIILMFLSFFYVFTQVSAEPLCDDIFTRPPSQGLKDSIIPPPSIWPPSDKKLTCKRKLLSNDTSCVISKDNHELDKFSAQFEAKDYAFDKGLLEGGEMGIFVKPAEIETPEKTTRLFFNELKLENATLNAWHKPSHLFLYVKGNLTVDSDSTINAVVYVEGNVILRGKAKINGALAVGGKIKRQGGSIEINDTAVQDANLVGICKKSNTAPVSQYLQFGIANANEQGAGRVVFEQAFFKGLTPLVFVMPTINPRSPNTDMPATTVISNITNTGFSFKQQWADAAEQGALKGSKMHKSPMKQIHWLAVLPGEHELPNHNSKLIAGTVSLSKALELGLDINKWKNLPEPINKDFVVLSQKQTSNNQCWLTTVVQKAKLSNRLQIALDTSKIKNQANCQANKLKTETVAYLAAEQGEGNLIVAGKNYHYLFGVSQTGKNYSDLKQQCDYLTNINQFVTDPVLVAGKQSRKGGDGGWLRRCQLSAHDFSMVNDEFAASDRRHKAENFGFMAFEALPETVIDIDHFELNYAGNPLACAPLDVTIKACADLDCDKLVDRPITINLAVSNNARWAPSKLTLSHGLGYSKLSNYEQDTFKIWVDHSQSQRSIRTLCRSNGSSASIDNCHLTFAAAGFVIDPVETYSGKVGTTYIKAVRKSSQSLECQPMFGGQTRDIQFWSSNNSDVIQKSNAQVWLDGEAMSSNQENASSHAVKFDQDGKAALQLKYADAGAKTIHAQYLLEESNDLLNMNSANGRAVFVPYGLCVQASKTYKHKQNTLGTVFKRAGETFPLTISARAWSKNSNDICQNAITPSFQQTGITLSNYFDPQLKDELIKKNPQMTWHDGVSSLTHYDHLPGNETKIAQSINEVGVFHFTAEVPKENAYLGSSLTIKKGDSGPVGRFVPAGFDVNQHGSSILPACVASGFSYMDQPFKLNLSLMAVNQQGELTQNYQGVLAKASAKLIAQDNHDSLNLGHRLSALPPLYWIGGNAELSYPVTFTRSQAPTMDGPFTNLAIGVDVADNDGGLSLLRAANMTISSVSNGKHQSARLIGYQDILQGRLVFSNTYGASNLSNDDLEKQKINSATISAKMFTEYWNGVNWEINKKDVCTSAGVDASVDVDVSLATQIDLPEDGYSFTPALTDKQSISRVVKANIKQGVIPIAWRETGAYRGKVVAPLEVADWLKWYWQWNNKQPNHLENPRASVYFGHYQVNAKNVYWHEIYSAAG